MSQQSEPQTTRAAASSRARPRGKGEKATETVKGELSQRKPPFSPHGVHGELRALLLSVGNVLARDEPPSLSRVSLSSLRAALSDFLGASVPDEAEELEDGTSRPSGHSRRVQASGGETKEQREQRMKRLKRRAADDIIIARLKARARGV